MADPTTLEEFANQQLTSWEGRLGAVRAEGSAAQAELAAAVKEQADAARARADAAAEVKRIRGELAAIPTSADAKPLLEQLDAATIAQRAAEWRILQAERKGALARARLERATTAVREAEAAKARAKAAAEAEKSAAERRAGLAAKLAEAPLATLASDATALLASQTASDAKAAVEKDVPGKLLERARSRVGIARERGKSRVAARDALADLRDAKLAALGSSADKLASPRAALEAAVASLEDQVTQAKPRFDRARAALVRLASPAKLALTPSQKSRLGDAALEADREAAADHEKALDEAVREREKVELARDVEQAKADAGEANDLAAKETELADRRNDEAAAQGNHSDAERRRLSEWEAAAPDEFWSDLAAHDEAVRVLDALATAAAGTLASAVTAAEGALVAALVADRKQRAAQEVYAAAEAARAVAVEFDAGAADRIAFAALRGDA